MVFWVMNIGCTFLQHLKHHLISECIASLNVLLSNFCFVSKHLSDSDIALFGVC